MHHHALITLIPHALRATTLAALVVFALLAAGCDAQRVRGDGGGAGQRAARAEAMAASGNYRGAAQLYEQAAAVARTPDKPAYLFSAAEAWLQGDEAARALMVMRRLDAPLPSDANAALRALDARVAMERGETAAALERLDKLPGSLTDAVASLAAETRGLAWFAAGDGKAAVQALIDREVWLDNSRSVLANQRLIWDGLAQLARNGKLPAPDDKTDDVVAGWLQLGSLAANAGEDSLALGASLSRWAADNTNHPASGGLLADMLRQYRSLTRLPSQMALVLPLSGPLQVPGAAIRDGFLAAYFATEMPLKPRIRLYDSAAQGAVGAYADAVREGAQFVAGPLSKTEITEIITMPGPRVPTLLLNYLPETVTAPASTYQYALAPEHEASAAAQHAISEGLTRAVALVPQTALGERLLGAFREALIAGGGTVLDAAAYNPAETDFKDPIRRVLQLDYSRSRHRQLVTELGMPLEFEPRRRRDVQFVFMVADAEAGRLLRPQLRFHYAQDLPVFATSSVYEPGGGNARDLEGVMFADMPWIIEPDEQAAALQDVMRRFWPSRYERRARLYAMGYDAYRLIPSLYSTQSEPAEPLQGVTGVLTLNGQGRVVRQLELARIHDGIAQRIVPELPDDSDSIEADAPDSASQPVSASAGLGNDVPAPRQGQ